MLDAVDISQSPTAIYREWLGSLPAAGLVVSQTAVSQDIISQDISSQDMPPRV